MHLIKWSMLGLSYEDLITDRVRDDHVSLFYSAISFLSKVFATYRAEVHIIDPVKKAALSRMLLDGIVSTKPGEKLDEKLANLILPSETGKRVSFN